MALNLMDGGAVGGNVEKEEEEKALRRMQTKGKTVSTAFRRCVK